MNLNDAEERIVHIKKTEQNPMGIIKLALKKDLGINIRSLLLGYPLL